MFGFEEYNGRGGRGRRALVSAAASAPTVGNPPSVLAVAGRGWAGGKKVFSSNGVIFRNSGLDFQERGRGGLQNGFKGVTSFLQRQAPGKAMLIRRPL